MASQDLQPENSSAMSPFISARAAALEQPELYKQVLPPVLGLMSEKPSVGVRRWVAGFIAEALGSAAVNPDEKERMVLTVLSAIKDFLDDVNEDGDIVKSAIVAAAVAYPVGFRHVVYHPEDTETWQNLQVIKNVILQRMDSYPPGIRACCIKFVQRVVQTQTPGTIDPRRPDKNETSLALVPRDHPLIPVTNVEAETSGLLDRILSVLQDDSSDALLIMATINAVGVLVKSRPAIANKIINTVLSYNPLKIGMERPLTTKDKITIRSIERTIRALFFNVMKRTPTHPQASRMQAYLESLSAGRIALFDESKKRPAPSELTREEGTKKQRTENAKDDLYALPPGPVSVAQLFTLTKDPKTQAFDVTAIPIGTVVKILVPIIESVDAQKLDAAINIVRERITSLSNRATAPAGNMTVEDDDEYEPDFSPMEDSEQVQNRIEMDSSEDLAIGLPITSQVLATFSLPAPELLNTKDLEIFARSSMDTMFRKIETQPSNAVVSANRKPSGFSRLAGAAEDRDAMVTTFARLLTRPSAGLSQDSENESGGPADGNGLHSRILSDRGRLQLLQYILSNWKARMDIATTWLTEEWYNDQICSFADQDSDTGKKVAAYAPNFQKWIHRFLDELSAFIGMEDSKLLIRFVSEVPSLDRDIVSKIKRLALDPERITMVVNAIHYLILFRPPVRNICLDALEDLWKNYDGAKVSTTPVLKKYRPAFLAEASA